MSESLDQQVRMKVFEVTAETGRVPSTADLGGMLGQAKEAVEGSLQRLAASRVIVLAPGVANVWMANPFSAVPTAFPVYASGRTYYGNCIWDALGIPAILNIDGRVETHCGDCDTEMVLDVRGGDVHGDGIVHFAVPAARWWDNIGYT